MIISEGISHLEYISYIESGGGEKRWKEMTANIFFLYLIHSLSCLQFYYLTIFQVELAGLKLSNPQNKLLSRSKCKGDLSTILAPRTRPLT